MLVNSFFCHFGSKARQKSSTSLQIIQGQGKNTTDTLIDFRPATVIKLVNIYFAGRDKAGGRRRDVRRKSSICNFNVD